MLFKHAPAEKKEHKKSLQNINKLLQALLSSPLWDSNFICIVKTCRADGFNVSGKVLEKLLGNFPCF